MFSSWGPFEWAIAVMLIWFILGFAGELLGLIPWRKKKKGKQGVQNSSKNV